MSRKLKPIPDFKKCTACGEVLPKEVFYPSKIGDGLRYNCKPCHAEKNKPYKKSPQAIANKKKYDRDNREVMNRRRRDKKAQDPVKTLLESKEYYAKHKETYKLYYLKNKEDITIWQRGYHKNRRASDPLYKLSCNIRCLIKNTFRNKSHKKIGRTRKILGCSYPEFRDWLQSKFTDGMTFQNYGSVWHIDHIVPISCGRTAREIELLNNYNNLRPLEDSLNCIKQDKFPEISLAKTILRKIKWRKHEQI